MALVLARRGTISGEEGTHLVDIDIYRPGPHANKNGMLRVKLFVVMTTKENGTVVGGCSNGITTFRIGKQFMMKPTGRTDYPLMLCM